MKKQTRLIILVFALIAILLLATGFASARATRTPFSGTEFFCFASPPERQWYTHDGEVWHVRGQILETLIESDEVRVAGINTVGYNFDLNLATGSGRIFGTFNIQPDAVDGTWEGIHFGRFSDYVASGFAVGHGTGALAGQLLTVKNQQIDIPDDPPCAAGGAGSTTGYILNPHGE
jgi:hypothetical protein